MLDDGGAKSDLSAFGVEAIKDVRGDSGDRVGSPGWRLQVVAELGEAGDLGFAGGGVVGELKEVGGDGLGGELPVEELGDEAAAGDEVGHRDGKVAVDVTGGRDFGGIADELAGEGVGEGRDAVDDDEGGAEEGGLDGRGTAGDGGGTGVVEGGSGV